jgi:ABC-type branched-subunit amino acid transport system substrate-binding protein
MTAGINYVLDPAASRKIVLLPSDESDNPATAVAKARKLVEGDRVSVVIGPMLAHSSAAVAPYLARAGVAHLPWGMADKPTSDNAIYTAGTGTGNAFVAG